MAPPALIERIRAAGAESYGIEAEQIDVSKPYPLAPSTCVVVETRNRNRTAGDSRSFVPLPDGSLLRAGNDDALGRVSKSCFLDSNLLPTPEAVPLLALKVGEGKANTPLGEVEGKRLLEELGEQWTPPSVTATDDGFVIRLFARWTATSEIFEVTSTITGDSASTEYRLVG